MGDLDVYEKQNFGNLSGIGERPALLIVDFVNGFADPEQFGGGNIQDATIKPSIYWLLRALKIYRSLRPALSMLMMAQTMAFFALKRQASKASPKMLRPVKLSTRSLPLTVSMLFAKLSHPAFLAPIWQRGISAKAWILFW
jgi:hypothetical protein